MGTFLRQWRAWVAVPVAVVVVVAALIAATVDTSALASTTYPGSIGPPASAAAGHGATTTTVASAASAGPPVRVLLFGDSVALTLGVGLSVPSVEDKYHYQLTDHGILGCGVVDGPAVELLGAVDETPPACNGTPLTPGEPAASQPWQDQWSTAMSAVRPNVVVVLAGRWEVVDRQYKGGWTNILQPAYAAYVKSQLEFASKLVTTAGANIVFLTAPCTNEGEQPDGAPWPEDNPARLAEYNKLLHQVAASHPKTDSVVDLNAAACPGGKFTPSLDRIPFRTDDGVHFTDAGGELVAKDIMPPIVAAGRAQMARAATTTTTTRPGRRPRRARQPAGEAGFGFTFCGLTFTLVFATTHCALSEGSRCPSSTSALSEMVVISEFHEPSSELASAASGRATRSS